MKELKVSNVHINNHCHKGELKKKYKGGVFKKQESIHHRLRAYILELEHEVYPFQTVFDIESMIVQDDLPGVGAANPKLNIKSKHIIGSVGVQSNVPKFDTTKCFVGDECYSQELVTNFLDYLNKISDQAYTQTG